MLYPKNQEKQLRSGLFKNPTSEYRGAPFWAWNGKLDKETLKEQIDIMKQMGMGGYHMHVRTGMDSPYLNDEFMDFIKTCIAKGEKEGMLSYLYDEDRWPSGAAGGLVTGDHPEFAAKSLMLTTTPYTEPGRENPQSIPGRGKGAHRNNNGFLLTVFDIELNADGTLKSYRQIGENEEATGKKWYVYLEHAGKDPWYNDAAYVDTMSEEAMRRFIDVTHERYKEAIGDKFGSLVPSIFTDEPQFNDKNTLSFAREDKDVFLPWTTDLNETFRDAYGEDLLANVPLLIWELPGGEVSPLRYHFHNHVSDRFVHAFCEQIGDWCRENGIALTGHVLGEESLYTQTAYLSEIMRCYRHFGIPGIDLLCDRHEYTTAKQCQSIVHQMGAEAMLCELYGVTGWDCDFRTYKLQGDWLAALGVTLRVPHLFWMTMKGEAKRDYPASIGYQSPWFDQYAMIEDHFARVDTAMTRGAAKVRVAVIHPIESYWLHWGPAEQTAAVREAMENSFQNLAQTLLFGNIDFDYISENELPYFCEKGGFPLKVGKMEYDAVVICGSETLRSTTIERLEAFHRAGGEIIFVGNAPKYMDAMPSDVPTALYNVSTRVAESNTAILSALDKYRFVDVFRSSGERENRLLYQLRQDGDAYWLFLATGKNPTCKDVDEAADDLRITLRGTWKVTLYDTMNGEISEYPVSYANGNTVIVRRWYMHDSMLLKLEPTAVETSADSPAAAARTAYEEILASGEAPVRFFDPVKVLLEEPNMLLLDMAEYRMNDGEYQPLEEILRLDNKVRKLLNIAPRRKEVTQPYKLKPETPADTVTLKFTIGSEIDVAAPELALEDADIAVIAVNGTVIDKKITGWFVDHSIQKVSLPAIQAGTTILEVTLPIGARTNLEDLYLLGDFGVRIQGTRRILTAPVRELGFGDFTHQGLPFYTGNLQYLLDVEVQDGLTVRVPGYRGGLIKVLVDGKDCGNIAFSPYALKIDGLEKGRHTIALRLYGTRQNGFAQLHHTPGVWFYQSPNSYRSDDDLWRYEYQFKEAGILSSPLIYTGSGKKLEKQNIMDSSVKINTNVM